MEDDYFSSYNRRIPLMGDIFDQVKGDLDSRNALGYSLHRRVLTDDTYKDFLKEAYEEALDLVVYLRGELNRRGRENSR